MEKVHGFKENDNKLTHPVTGYFFFIIFKNLSTKNVVHYFNYYSKGQEVILLSSQ